MFPQCIIRMVLPWFVSFVSLWFLALDARATEPASWDSVPTILARIQTPDFPERNFPITDFGAVSDGRTDARPAVSRAINACHEAGGGRVVVPPGTWLVQGPLRLKSNVNLFFADGATLRFSNQPTDFLPPVLTRFEGTELINYSPLIYAYEAENIALTGRGTLDGQADAEHWWPWKGRAGRGPNQARDVDMLRRMGEEGMPVADRRFGDGHYLRPNFVQPYRSKNILIEGVTFTNSPMWILNPVLCTNVTIRGVTFDSHGPNNDGCDPESCRDVLIENCTFNTGDDCIAIKSGRNADGRRVGVPSENIIIRGCTMRDGHGGVVLGSEMSGGIRNVFVDDCRMDSPHLDRAIRLKSNSLRGGYLENLFVRNLQIGQVREAVLRINLRYEDGVGSYPPVVRNIHLENVTSTKSGRPLYLVGLPDAKIQNVAVENCTFRGAAKPSVLEHVENLTLENVRILPREGLDND